MYEKWQKETEKYTFGLRNLFGVGTGKAQSLKDVKWSRIVCDKSRVLVM